MLSLFHRCSDCHSVILLRCLARELLVCFLFLNTSTMQTSFMQLKETRTSLHFKYAGTWNKKTKLTACAGVAKWLVFKSVKMRLATQVRMVDTGTQLLEQGKHRWPCMMLMTSHSSVPVGQGKCEH